MQQVPIQFDDFSGGITDNFINPLPNTMKSADNFLITGDKKPYTRNGCVLFDDANPRIPIGNQRVGALINYDETLLLQSGQTMYYYDGAFQTIGNVLPDITVNNTMDYDIFNRSLYVTSDNHSPLRVVYKDNLGAWKFRTAGLPALPSSPTIGGAAGLNNYIYGFVYSYSYYVGSVEFLDVSEVKYVSKTQINEPSVSTVAITNIPEYVNAVDENYDTASFKIQIYRTLANEETLYYVGEVSNGTTNFNDTVADSTLVNGVPIYTTGGVLENGTPPRAKTIHSVNGVMYYGNIKSGTSIRSNRIFQSVPNDPDSVPSTNFRDVEDEIIAISSYMDRPLVFCKNSVYRLEGSFDERGDGYIEAQKIADTIGCISANSIVQTPVGVFFASNKGFAYTDGFTCKTISNNFPDTYKNFSISALQKRHIYGTFDDVDNRVMWTTQTEQTGEPNKLHVLDLRWGVSENSTFTSFSGVTLSPTSLLYFDNELLQGDSRGYLLAYRSGALSDSHIDPTISPSSWYQDPIIYNLETVAIKPFQTTRAFIPKVLISARNTSNLSVKIVSDSDIGKKVEIKPIRWRGNLTWGDPLFTWGSDTFRWGVAGFIEQQRYFNSKDLRCTHKQLQLTNAEAEILSSDSVGTVTNDTIGNTSTLDNVSEILPEELGGYYISFSDDNYSKQYFILNNSASTVQVDITSGTIPSGTHSFKINGIPKDEVLSLLSITFLVSPLGNTQERYTPSQGA